MCFLIFICSFYLHFSLQMLRIIVLIIKCSIKIMSPFILYQKRAPTFCRKWVEHKLERYFAAPLAKRSTHTQGAVSQLVRGLLPDLKNCFTLRLCSFSLFRMKVLSSPTDHSVNWNMRGHLHNWSWLPIELFRTGCCLLLRRLSPVELFF